MALITEEIKAKAQMVFGDEAGREKCELLLKEVGLPNGLMPLKDIVECGYVEETGFVWLKMKKKMEHKYEKIGKVSQFAPEITAYVDKTGRFKKITGVKSKELMIWITVSEMYKEGEDKITFKTPTGLSKSYPAEVFIIPEAPPKSNKAK